MESIATFGFVIYFEHNYSIDNIQYLVTEEPSMNALSLNAPSNVACWYCQSHLGRCVSSVTIQMKTGKKD